MPLARSLTPLVDLVFPPRCPLCGDPLAEQGGLCVGCWGSLTIPGEPACVVCQRPLDHASVEPAEVARCAPCLASLPPYDGLTAATLYTDASRKLVLAFKHGRRIALADLLARLIAVRLPALEGEWLVVPVPLHRWRLWRRGFNQSALLGAKLAAAAPGRRLAVDALVRRRATPSLGGLDRHQRRCALAGSIVANPRWTARLAGARVLLVDDVVTSGATTDAAIVALRQANVRSVRVACFARVLD